MIPTELARIADELYAERPDHFVAARNARAASLRPGDRALADAVKVLRRPAPAAWVVNLLARDGALDDALALAPQIRAAQESPTREEIVRLRVERRELLDALARRGGELAEAAGAPVATPVLESVTATLSAALADQRAGEAVGSGRLLRPLEAGGFDPVDVTDAVAVPDGIPAPRASKARRTAQERDAEKDAARERSQRAAREAEDAARDAASEAAAALETATAEAETAARARGEWETRVDTLEDELRDARRALADAERDEHRRERQRSAAERDAETARDRLEEATRRRSEAE